MNLIHYSNEKNFLKIFGALVLFATFCSSILLMIYGIKNDIATLNANACLSLSLSTAILVWFITKLNSNANFFDRLLLALTMGLCLYASSSWMLWKFNIPIAIGTVQNGKMSDANALIIGSVVLMVFAAISFFSKKK